MRIGRHRLAANSASRYEQGMIFRLTSALIVAVIAVSLTAPAAHAQAMSAGAGVNQCTRSEFEDVVDEAAEKLRVLNQQNKPLFQEKLRSLKDKRGWDHEAFLKEAAPFVKDEQIEVYDRSSETLLNEISKMGQTGSAAPTPDCALLLELRARMTTLVETQTAKWAYMFKKLEGALTQ